jgi:hypothetical protein
MCQRLSSAIAAGSEAAQLVTAIDPGVPILNRLLSTFVNSQARQLNQRYGQQPLLPRDIHEHLMLADFFCGQTAYLHNVANPKWRRWTLNHAPRLEWKPEVILEVVVPAKRLFFRPVGVNDDLPIESLVKTIVTSAAGHRTGPV